MNRGFLHVLGANLQDRGDGPSEMFFDRARQIEPRDRSNSLDGLLKLGEWSAVQGTSGRGLCPWGVVRKSRSTSAQETHF